MLIWIATISAILVTSLSTIRYFKRNNSSIYYGIVSLLFEIYVIYQRFIGMKKKNRKDNISLRLQLIDEYCHKYVRKEFINHSIDSALKLLLRTREITESFTKYSSPPSNVTIKLNKINNIQCAWINPKNISKYGVIICFHGGAYVSGCAESCFPYLIPLCSMTNMAGCSVEYSLAPERVLPKPVDEGLAVYKYFIQKLKLNPKSIVFMGDSAGGSLVLLLIQKLIKLNIETPCCAITSSAWNIPTEGNSYIKNKDKDCYLDQTTSKILSNFAVGNIDIDLKTKKCYWIDIRTSLNCEYCSYLHKNATFKGFCPLFMSVSEYEAVFDDTLSVIQRCKKQNIKDVVCEIIPSNGIHVLENWVGYSIPESLALLQKEAHFIVKHRKLDLD